MTTSTLSDHSRWLTEQLIDRMEVGFEVDQQFCFEHAMGFDDDDTFVYLEQLGAVVSAIDMALTDVFHRRHQAIVDACDLIMSTPSNKPVRIVTVKS